MRGGSPQRSGEFLERACAPEYAATFRLYKLYNRGASFSRLDR